jgi:hypothetical protein
MRFSILHISDLHRDRSNEISNAWLLHSLTNDISRFDQQETTIIKPSLCIVSGDIVYGVKPGTANAEAEITRQYKQAEEFLAELVDLFFAGNRERIVLLPGNHDVFYSDVIASAQAVGIPPEPDRKAALVAELFAPNSQLRWSWNELCFYRIVDAERYKQRFRPFASMYQSFYQGNRSFSLAPDQQHAIFDFPDLGFCVAGLNSCFNNDPLRRAGTFEPSALANTCRILRAPERAGWLAAAAWHHNVAGGPTNDDYIDTQFLQLLIDADVSMGFHGHQHMPECFDERYRIGPSPRKMTIISASTLCSEPRNLKPGVPRSYNVVELDTDTWMGRVHQRQMVNYIDNLPVWGPGHFISSNRSYVDFEICKPTSSRPAQLDKRLILEKAEANLGAQEWGKALVLLDTVKEQPLARLMLVRALCELGDARRTIAVLWPPQSISETVTLGGAVLEAGTKEEAEAFVRLSIVSESSDASIKDMVQRIRRRRL